MCDTLYYGVLPSSFVLEIHSRMSESMH
jgi:hypothetical protein